MNHDIINYLGLISQVKPGDTINVSTLEVLPHNSWYCWASRNYNRETRETTVTWVETAIIQALNMVGRFYRQTTNDDLLLGLNKAIIGIRNLASTYNGDPLVTKLESIIASIECRICKINQLYCNHCHIQHINNTASILARHNPYRDESTYPKTY